MFKIGDIIKLSHDYIRVIYPTDLLEVDQSFIVIKLYKPLIHIKGLKNNRIFVINANYFQIDLELTRKLKLEKLCSKLVI